MNVILLSGGSGKRLWPLSNEIRSKQFIKILKKDDGSYESMVQYIYRNLKAVDKDVNIVIATSKTQVSSIHNQLGTDVNICVEPSRRDTFPAVALAGTYMLDVVGVDVDEPVVVCPVDPYVSDDYFRALSILSDLANMGDANLSIMGMEPTYPSEKYGYVIPEDSADVSRVLTFKEKPDEATAAEYISKGGLWNGGVFAFKLGYLLNKAHELIDFTDYEDLLQTYAELNKISFDYAVCETESDIQVLRYNGSWKDLGTWNTLTEAMKDTCIGNVIMDDNCENVHVVNELDVPILCMSLKDMVVSASPDGILVSDKKNSSYIKPYVESLDNEIMYAEKSWGEYKVISVEDKNLIVRVLLNPGHEMNYHSHEHRDESWIVISGTGFVIIDDYKKDIKPGDIIKLPIGTRHMVHADTELIIFEVQQGESINVNDKVKHEMPDKIKRELPKIY